MASDRIETNPEKSTASPIERPSLQSEFLSLTAPGVGDGRGLASSSVPPDSSKLIAGLGFPSLSLDGSQTDAAKEFPKSPETAGSSKASGDGSPVQNPESTNPKDKPAASHPAGGDINIPNAFKYLSFTNGAVQMYNGDGSYRGIGNTYDGQTVFSDGN